MLCWNGVLLKLGPRNSCVVSEYERQSDFWKNDSSSYSQKNQSRIGWVLARLTMLWWFFQEYEQFIWLGSGLPKSRLRILKNLIISNLQNGIYNTRTGLWILFLLKVYLPWLPFARLSTELMPKQAVSGSIQFLKWAALEKGWKVVCQDCPFMFLFDRCLMSLWNAAGLCIVSWELLKVC